MLHTILDRLKENYKKARYELKFLRGRSYAQFVFERQSRELKTEIPVFCFHSVSPEDLEEKLAYLQTNGYRTLTADAFYDCLHGRRPLYSKPVMLTFDDGWRSLWTVAYPLLKKYGFVAVAFIVPTWVQDSEESYPSLETDKATIQEITSHHHRSREYVTWQEIREMHDSAVIDFQSHSLTHATVFTSEKIVDFLHPQSKFSAHKIPIIPLPEDRGGEESARLGRPLYTIAPRLTGARRYMDDPCLREACISYVNAHGGEIFFKRASWRKDLVNFVAAYKAQNPLQHRYETDIERMKNIAHEFIESKRMIEDRLGKLVRHFCYPFFSGSELALSISQQCGYITNYWGWYVSSRERIGHYGCDHLYATTDLTDLSTSHILKGRRTNRLWDDPFRIVRVPADYIFRLPGKGRRSLAQIIIRKTFRNLAKSR